MKKHLMTAAALSLVLGAPSMALADEGWYLSGGIGYGAPGDADVSGALGNPNAANGGRISGESNWREKVSVGYQWATGWRIEGELAHRYNNLGSIGNHEDSHAKFQTWTGMVNVLYDFNTGSFWRPYVGAGLGYADVTASLAGWNTGTRPVGSVIPGDPRYIQGRSSNGTLAYQLIAGVGWALSPQLTLDTEYRYFGHGETTFDPSASIDVEGLRGHEAWIGLRYLFAAPPAPPPPPPPSCEDAEFVVYFEWDRSNVTDQSRNVINSAINTARNCGVAAVRVDGHADRSGSAAYNVGLSERRARAVRDELVRLGVPAGAVSINAYGESRPAVATPDGVREPLNRRVEVLINLN